MERYQFPALKLLPVLIAGLSCSGILRLVAADFVTSVDTSVSREDNVTRCPDPEAVKSGTFYDVSGSAEWRTQVSRDVSVQFSTDAGLQSCPEFSGLDRSSAGLHFGLRRKLGLGPLAPALRADLSYTESWYRDTAHNGTRLNASLSWSQRWNETWQTVLTGEYLNNDGHSHAYDYSNRGLAFETRYDFSEKWQLTAGLRRQWGDQVTYAWVGGSGAYFPYVGEIWQNSSESTTFGRNWYAYTIDAHADTVSLSASYALDPNSSLTLRFDTTSVVGHGESYHNRQVSLNLAHRF